MDDPVEIQPFMYSEPPSASEKQIQSLSNPTTKSCISFGCSKQTTLAWFDVKVFYVRVSSCLLDQAPETLLIVYPKRDINTELEVNGGRISPSERACFALRRDRVDTESAEATYVNTNNLRSTGDLAFEIFDKDELLVLGSVSRTDVKKDHHQLLEGYSSIGTSPLSNEAGWSMDCSCVITSATCCFMKGRVNFSTVNPTMEVYVAGRSAGLPIVLTQTMQLTARRKSLRCCSLDIIPEEEESQCDRVVLGQVADDGTYPNLASRSLALGIPNGFYLSDISGGGEGGEGELSWFNAGVRVGVGLGLGMCLGVGIGVGLLMRTYHATTGSFRRRLF